MKYDIYFKKSIVDYYNKNKKNKKVINILFTTIATCFNISKSSIYSWINSDIGNNIPNLTEYNNLNITPIIENYVIAQYNIKKGKSSVKKIRNDTNNSFKLQFNNKQICCILKKNNLILHNSINNFNNDIKPKIVNDTFNLSTDNEKIIIELYTDQLKNNAVVNIKKIINDFNIKCKIVLHEKDIVNVMHKYKIGVKSYFKITKEIEKFIVDHAKNKHILKADEYRLLILNEFKTSLTRQSIYNILNKHGFKYKKYKINNNPYTDSDQLEQIKNVIAPTIKLTNLNDNVVQKTYENDTMHYIDVMNNKLNIGVFTLYNTPITLINKKPNILIKTKLIKYNASELYEINFRNTHIITLPKMGFNDETIDDVISIDEISFVLDSRQPYAWFHSLLDTLKIDNPKINGKRYTIVVATSNKKILHYLIVEKGLKTDDYIKFIQHLINNPDNKNKIFFMDNARIHTSVRFKKFAIDNDINVLYNAPYHSEFNPIEYVFSMLRNYLNRNLTKTYENLISTIDEFIKKDISKELGNIYNHCIKLMKNFIIKYDINNTIIQ